MSIVGRWVGICTPRFWFFAGISTGEKMGMSLMTFKQLALCSCESWDFSLVMQMRENHSACA